jgi:hypothetical protein
MIAHEEIDAPRNSLSGIRLGISASKSRNFRWLAEDFASERVAGASGGTPSTVIKSWIAFMRIPLLTFGSEMIRRSPERTALDVRVVMRFPDTVIPEFDPNLPPGG